MADELKPGWADKMGQELRTFGGQHEEIKAVSWPRRRRQPHSPETRARMSEAQRARWAGRKVKANE